MTKIAVASIKENVAENFGDCSNFNIFEVENEQPGKAKFVPNPGRSGYLPSFLNNMKVDVLIAGKMGENMVNSLKEKGIKIVLGAGGSAQEVAQAYLQGTLK